MDELTGILASGNHYRVTAYEVEIKSQDNELQRHTMTHDLVGVRRDGTTVEAHDVHGRSFAMTAATETDAIAIERLLLRIVPAMTKPQTPSKTGATHHAVWISICVVGAIIAVWLAASDGPDSFAWDDSREVVYRVTDTSGAPVRISYDNAGGNRQQDAEAAVPWVKRYTMERGSWATIHAYRGRDAGTIRCTISVDGEIVEESESTGPNVSASCTGRIP